MEKLPVETLETIFESLSSLNDIQNCLKTCSKWNKIIRKKYQNKGICVGKKIIVCKYEIN